MKKLNRKGFTLVELLAVIIILAVVVGITIPAVLTTTQKAKAKAFQSAADTAADWFDRQYQVYTTGLNDTEIATLDANFKSGCIDGVTTTDASGNTTTTTCLSTNGLTFTSSTNKALVQAAGLKVSNIYSMNVKINASTGRSCVTLTATADGDYNGASNTTDDVTINNTSTTLNTITSSGC